MKYTGNEYGFPIDMYNRTIPMKNHWNTSYRLFFFEPLSVDIPNRLVA